MKTLSAHDARECALAIHGGVDFGSGGMGLRIAPEAAEALRVAGTCELGQPLANSRRSAGGAPLDSYAPSAWHALCALLFQDVFSRIRKGSFFTALETFSTSFGSRPFYRGQSRCWDIVPSAWRSDAHAQASSHTLPAFRSAIGDHLARHPDPISILSMRPTLRESSDGLAQHYGLPTNLVDLTWDPVVAMKFACGPCEAPACAPRHARGDRLADCAVVYFMSAPVVHTVASARFEFPPAFSMRLYEQSGLFADFGPYPGEDASLRLEAYDAPWTWLQMNAGRIFFPRDYPGMDGAPELEPEGLMQGDEFLAEVAQRVKAGEPAGPDHTQLAPPWAANSSDSRGKARQVAAFLRRVDGYLRRACLMKFEDGDVFDPFLVRFMADHAGAEIEALRLVGGDVGDPVLSWTSARLNEALAALRSLALIGGVPPLEGFARG